MSFGGIKRTKADAFFSDHTREEADWICERCKKSFENNHKSLHCSHYITRGNPRTRFDINNVAALCVGCHDHMGKNPHEHREFFFKRLGEERYSALMVRANTRRTARLDYKLEEITWKLALELLREIKNKNVIGRKK